MENDYNGFKNRSTWLARLWLENTNQEVYSSARDLARRWKEMQDYWKGILERDPHSYSYPFHQHAGIQKELKELLRLTGISKEDDYFFNKVDIAEVLEAVGSD